LILDAKLFQMTRAGDSLRSFASKPMMRVARLSVFVAQSKHIVEKCLMADRNPDKTDMQPASKLDVVNPFLPMEKLALSGEYQPVSRSPTTN